ncbi:MAG: protein kinase [Anaerolineaceae bacterium]|nr:protein kinase [Anaerolineaceae bacterium]
MTNLIGQSLGRYHILEPLGEGGMAVVYKAYDTRLERDVALKVIRRNAFSPDVLERVLKRFDREAKSLAKLTHPNIVSIIDYGDFEGSPYLVMPYLQGGTLKQVLGKPIPYTRAVEWLTPIADALGYAHQKGIVHRDVKPGNILVTEGGQPMLTDFGIARLLESEAGQTLTGTGVGIGTPEYMAPEQGLGKEVDGRTDVYALGVVLYELVTGRKPYTADTPLAVVFKHLTDPLPRPRELVPHLPEAAERVLFKALAKKPDDRYQSMREFTAAMSLLMTHEKESRLEKAVTLVDATQISDIYATVDQLEPTPANTLPMQPEIPTPQTEFPPPAPKPKTKTWLWLGGVGLLTVIAIRMAAISAENPSIPTQPAATLMPILPALSSTPYPPTQPAATDMPIMPALSSTPYPQPRNAIQPEDADRVVQLRTLKGHTSGVRSVAFSPDGATLASGSWDGTIRLWRVTDGSQLRTLAGHTNGVTSVAFSPDGATLASGSSDKTIRLWRVTDGSQLRTLKGHTSGVWSVAFSPDGATLTSGSSDKNLRLWRVTDGSQLRMLKGHTRYVNSVAFSPDGATLATGSEDNIWLWRVSDGSLLRTLEGHTGWLGSVRSVVFSPDGATLASGSGDGTVRLWGVEP